jgi:hypothetical protein
MGVHYNSDPTSSSSHFKKAELSSKYLVKEDVEDEKNYSQLIKNTRFLSRNTIGSPLSIHLNHLCGNIEDRLSLSCHSPDIYIVQRVLRI